MDLRGQYSVLRTHRLIVVGSIVLAMLAALVVSVVSPKVYESRATLIVGQSLSSANPDIGQIDTSQRLSATYAQIATTRPVLEAVIAKLGLTVTPEELVDTVEAAAATNSTLLTVAVSQPDPVIAAAIANEIGAQLIAASPAVSGGQSDVQTFLLEELRTLQAQIEAAQQEADQLNAVGPRTEAQERRLGALEARLTTLRSAYATLHSQSVTSAANQLSVVDPAVPAPSPASPSIPLNLLLALIAGALIGVAAAFLLDYLDDSIKDADAAEAITGLAVLGTVPRMRDLPGDNPIYSLVTLTYPRSAAAEAFRMLRTNLEFAGIDAPVRTIVITSPLPGEGKTTIATNLAVAFAQTGRRTLLVDADLRRPGVNAVFDLPQSPGLTDVLRSDTLALSTVLRPTQEPNLHVVTSGVTAPNPAELVGSARMESVLKELSGMADVVVVDTPPVNVVTDAVLLAKLVDGTILVINSGRTRRGAARDGCDALGRIGVRMLGLTLNGHRTPERRPYEYYTDEEDGQVASQQPQPGAAPPLADEPRLP